MNIKHAVVAALLTTAGASQAAIIGFEGLASANDSFTNLGLSNTYQGYSWSSAGSAQQPTDWGVAVGSTGGLSAHSGSGYGWTYNGGQSLYINFGAATNVIDVYVGGQFAGNNAATVQLFGYDAANVLVAQTGVTNLALGQWSQVVANLNGIYRLEFRSNAATRWFGVDDLQVNPAVATVPEPSTLALVALAGLGVAAIGRRRRA